MHKGVCPHFPRCIGKQVALVYKIYRRRHISGGGDHVGVFVSLAHETDYIGPLLLDSPDALRGAGNTLIYNNDLKQRVIGQTSYLRNCCFHLRHKIIRISDMPDHPAFRGISVLFQAVFRAAYFIFTLGKSTGDDSHMVRRSRAGRAPQEKRRHRYQAGLHILKHHYPSTFFLCFFVTEN
ncbi:hypothetical protein SDC9_102070 [bioreactor metagenome]|uniref:Uncharacterized protein n=1 Tax=bioreactor metagenome TaxID=1076179 RepID=A0A645AQU3_9ZZZZ